MATELMANFLVFLALSMLLIWLRHQFRMLRHDRFRFGLFTIRDELYLMVAEGKLDRESLLFVGLRRYVNSTIEWSEELGAIALFRALGSMRSLDQKNMDEVDRLLSELPDEVKAQYLALNRRALEITLDIVRDNSLILRQLTRLARLRKALSVPDSKPPEECVPQRFRSMDSVKAAMAIRSRELSLAA